MSEQDIRPLKFVKALAGLDRGELAKLRRSLGGDERGVYWLEGLYARTGYGSSNYAKPTLQLVAGLYALKPNREGKEDSEDLPEAGKYKPKNNIGELMGKLYRLQEKRPSTEKRFMALLDTDRDGLGYHMRQIISLLISNNAEEPDWVELTTDLLYWNDKTRQKWARSFYASAAETDSQETSSTPEGENK